MGSAVAALGASIGLPLMPWQAYVSGVAGEVDKQGQYVYDKIVVTVPRQSGKSALTIATMNHRVLQGAGRRAYYTAQTGVDARNWWRDDFVPQLRDTVLWPNVVDRWDAGSTGIYYPALGSQVFVFTPKKTGLHGKHADMIVVDEAWSLDAERGRELKQAIVPTMATRQGAQYWDLSTAGDANSHYLWEAVKAGRAAVENNETSGIAYFEWSASPDDDVTDPKSWSTFHPAYGYTISEQSMKAALTELGEPEFRRAYCNLWPPFMGEESTAAEPAQIDAELWRGSVKDGLLMPEPSNLVLAFDVDAGGLAGCIVACWETEGARHVEVVEHRPNPADGWLVERLVELAGKYDPLSLVHDTMGGASYIADELILRGVLDVKPVPTRDYSAACAGFISSLQRKTLTHATHPGLDAAAGYAFARTTSSGWVWQRNYVDISVAPVIAATLAVWAWDHAAAPAFTVF